jgi:predicted flap endonuclease-1-like 5' DNA nuclease
LQRSIGVHRNILAQKRIEAQQEMASLAASIGEKLDIKDAPEKVRGAYHRDPQLKQLYQDEALVGLLREIEAALSAREGEPAGLEGIEGIGEELAETLREAGFHTADELQAASDEQLLAIEGIGEATVKRIREQIS